MHLIVTPAGVDVGGRRRASTRWRATQPAVASYEEALAQLKRHGLRRSRRARLAANSGFAIPTATSSS